MPTTLATSIHSCYSHLLPDENILHIRFYGISIMKTDLNSKTTMWTADITNANEYLPLWFAT